MQPRGKEPLENLRRIVVDREFSSDSLVILATETEKRFRSQSRHVDADGQFQRLGVSDLEQAFRAIDQVFFADACRTAVESGGHQLSFRLGVRMTRCGGKTTTRPLDRKGRQKAFEIALSPRLLLETFRHRSSAVVTGLACHSPLEAMLRVMEHEILHMVEMLIWSESSCSRDRFRSMARRLFGHQESTHELLTPTDLANITNKLRIGNRVSFRHGEKTYLGIINGIHRRATVLVVDRDGTPYRDGNRYRKFYVPLERLKNVS